MGSGVPSLHPVRFWQQQHSSRATLGKSKGAARAQGSGADRGGRLDQERPALSRHRVFSPSAGRWGGAGGALTPLVRGGAGRESLCNPHLLRGPAPQTDPGSCIATGCSAPQCPANSGGADGAYWWDCLGRPPPLPSAFFSLSPASLPASALWNLSLQNAFPSPTGYKQRRCPLPWAGQRSLLLVSKGRGSRSVS